MIKWKSNFPELNDEEEMSVPSQETKEMTGEKTNESSWNCESESEQSESEDEDEKE